MNPRDAEPLTPLRCVRGSVSILGFLSGASGLRMWNQLESLCINKTGPRKAAKTQRKYKKCRVFGARGVSIFHSLGATWHMT